MQQFMSRISPKRVLDFVEDSLWMLLGRIKSLSMSNPCVFQNGPNKEDQRRVKLFYSDVLNSKFDDEITDILDLDYMS